MRTRQGYGRLFLVSTLAVAVVGAAGFAFRRPLTIGVQRDGSIIVPNGQQLTPAGTHIEVNDRPLGMVLSPNHRLMAVVTGSNFNPRGLHLIDVQTIRAKAAVSPIAHRQAAVFAEMHCAHSYRRHDRVGRRSQDLHLNRGILAYTVWLFSRCLRIHAQFVRFQTLAFRPCR